MTGGKLFLLCFLSALPITLLASGSHSAYKWSDPNKYEKGKKVFAEKLVCQTCPYGNSELSQDDVSAIVSELTFDSEIGKNLTVYERYSVKHYLNERFNLKPSQN